MSNDQVSWLAPPDSFAGVVTPVARGKKDTTQRASSAWIIGVSRSFALELRRTFLQERRDAFLEILRRAHGPLRLEFEVELILE